jgi:AcrR family transcriptional regulator
VRRAARSEKSASRREAILAAALDEFSTRGFDAARLDDVARRAKVAKGTIYLYFRDKESLFEELLRHALGPVIGALDTAAGVDVPFKVFAERLAQIFVREIYGTQRKDVLRLVLTEGPRFPRLAQIHYRQVITPAMAAVRKHVQRAIDRGEIAGDALIRFPQLLVAPGLVAIMWEALFARIEPLDVEAMMRAHVELLLRAVSRSAP